jgi:hypothetical protein
MILAYPRLLDALSSEGWTATSAGGNPKMSQPPPTSTLGSLNASLRKSAVGVRISAINDGMRTDDH